MKNSTDCQSEVEVFDSEVSDESLEAAAATELAGAYTYTLGFCTGLSTCPA
jgi:hypothetical protein